MGRGDGDLAARGLLHADGRATDTGRTLHGRSRSRPTLAGRLRRLGDAALADLQGVLAPAPRDVVASGVLPFPNPMGLPRVPVRASCDAAVANRPPARAPAQRARRHHLAGVAQGPGVVAEPCRHLARHFGGAGTWPARTSTSSVPEARIDSVRVRPGAMEKAKTPCVGELDVAHVGDAVEGRLGGGVGHAPAAGAGRRRRGGEGRLREHVHQAARAALEHLGQEQLGEEQRVEVVAHQAALGQFKGEIKDPVHGARAPGRWRC